MTPLHIAADFGHHAVVEALAKSGAAVNQGKADGANPQIIAAENGHLAVVKAVVKGVPPLTICHSRGGNPAVHRHPEQQFRGGGQK